MVKKHSEHKGPAPPPPPPSLVIKPVLSEEPQNIPVVLKVQDSNQENETQLIPEPKESMVPKNVEYSEINDSINNNSEVENLPFDVDVNNSVPVQSVHLRKHEIINARPMSVATSINGPTVNSVEDSQIRTRRRSSSASNRNQRRPSPPSLDKVLQMNQNIEKNKGKLPTAVMNELAGRLQNNQDETDRIQGNENSN